VSVQTVQAVLGDVDTLVDLSHPKDLLFFLLCER
jgi:hypothetical protein